MKKGWFLIIMQLCATAALLLHPLLYIVGIDFYIEEPQIIIFYYLTYGIIGTLLWHIFRGVKLWKQRNSNEWYAYHR